MALIGYTITVVAKQDNPYNVLPETDISIRKNSDNTLVNIYADEAGLIPIAQLGAKTDSNGQFTFYADASLGVLKAVWTNGGVTSTEVLDKSDHSRLVNRNAVGAHDAIYRRETTVAEIALGDFKDGDKLTVTDRANAPFNIVSGGTANGLNILNAGTGKTAIVGLVGTVDLGWLTSLDGSTANDDAVALCVSLGLPMRVPALKLLRLTVSLVTDKDIVIVGDGGQSSILINDCADSVTALTQNGAGSKVFRLEGLKITNPNLRKNRISNSVLNVFEYTLKDLFIQDSFDGFYSEKQWVSPSIENVIFRNTNMTAAYLAGSKCIYMLKCNTIDLSSISITGAWDFGAHLKNDAGEGNFTVKIDNFTAQGVNGTDKMIGKALWIEGGDGITIGSMYTEKTREEDCVLINNATAVTFSSAHLVQGSLTLNNCQSNLSSVGNYVVNAADPAGLSTIKVVGGRCDTSNLYNYTDYDFRYEKGDGTGIIKGNLRDAIPIPTTPINSGTVGLATAEANTQLVNLGSTGALRITTTGVGGVKFGISSANVDDDARFIIAARIRVVSGGIKVRSQKISGTAPSQMFPILHTWQTSTDKWNTIYFYSKKTASGGAACQFIADGAGVFDIIPISYLGW